MFHFSVECQQNGLTSMLFILMFNKLKLVLSMGNFPNSHINLYMGNHDFHWSLLSLK